MKKQNKNSDNQKTLEFKAQQRAERTNGNPFDAQANPCNYGLNYDYKKHD